jgi:putative tricarboxylic transport membrane protein
MDTLSQLLMGIQQAATPANLLFCLLGTFLGTLIGVLPGLGPAATVAMLLPMTFRLSPLASLIMLAGIFYGAQYGGSTTAILVRLPGESSSVVTCLDGYAMARKGRAGAALAVAALGSFFAGTIATLVIAFAAPPLSQLAVTFGPAEYVSLMTFGLVGATILASGSVLSAVGMIFLGLLLGLVGTDLSSGALRYTFDIPALFDGLGFVTVAVGIFGLTEIIANLEESAPRILIASKLSSLWPTREELRRSLGAMTRGTILGCLLGVLPGGGATLSSFASYSLEKKVSRHPERFGSGEIEGVAGPEAANNAGSQTAFIPLLTLGIPVGATMALMIGAMMIHGVAPGPGVIKSNPQLFWGLIASMWIGNAMLLVINLPLIGIWVKLLSIPYRFLFPSILLFCCIGVYSLNNSVLEIGFSVFFGFLGYIFRKFDCEPAPMLLGFILGPMLEENFRRAMLINQGSYMIFVQRPISLVLLVATAGLFLLLLLPGFQKKRGEMFQEEA